MSAREIVYNNVMEKDKKKTLTISSNFKKKLIQVQLSVQVEKIFR